LELAKGFEPPTG